MTITVGIDGYNLAMPMGTGIATYARTLASTVKHMGGKTLGVFDVDAGGDPDLQEVLFFDRLTHPMVRKKSLIARWRNWRWKVPDLVEINRGAVDRRPMLDRIPDFDRLATGPSLFAAAFRQFWRTGQMATLSLANPPDIMHWTCPVPLKLAGSRNVYTIHDLVPLRMPYMTLDNKRLFHALTRACVQAADHVQCFPKQLARLQRLIRHATFRKPLICRNTRRATSLAGLALCQGPIFCFMVRWNPRRTSLASWRPMPG